MFHIVASDTGGATIEINQSNLWIYRKALSYTDTRCLTTGIRSEKCVVRRFRRCANAVECTYTKLDIIAYNTPSLYGIAYCS